MPKVFLVKNRATAPSTKDCFSPNDNDPVRIEGKVVKNCSFREYSEIYQTDGKWEVFEGTAKKWLGQQNCL